MQNLSGKRIHFIGVNGTGVSALIRLARDLGATVSGSDNYGGEYIDALKKDGFDVYMGINPSISKNCDLVVYSGAVKENHPELNGKASMERGAFLGELSQHFEKVVAVAGTHGKTTVCAMIAHVLKKANYPFTYIFGGIDVDSNSNYGFFGKKILITEACEYRNSFLSILPDISIINSIEYDHPDFFTKKEDLTSSFGKFCNNTKECAILGKNLSKTLECIDAHVHIRAFDSDFTVSQSNGYDKCTYLSKNEKVNISLKTAGEYNLTNAIIATDALLQLGVNSTTIEKGLSEFKGVKRRREYLGDLWGKKCYSDYAHHPTQISALLASFKSDKRVCIVFEPHTYSRTKQLINEFKNAFTDADSVIILPVYPAREKYDKEGDSVTLFGVIEHDNKYLVNGYSDAEKLLKNIDADIVLFAGAGTIDEWGRGIKGMRLCFA